MQELRASIRWKTILGFWPYLAVATSIIGLAYRYVMAGR